MKKTLRGRVSNEKAGTAPVVSASHTDFPEIERISDTFKITVKDDNDAVIYENKAEPFVYYKIPSLTSALKYYGAKLSDDAIQFIGEALQGDETGKAVQTLLEVINADEKASASRRQYSAVLNEKKPLGEEQVENAYASILRNYLKTNPGISPETALQTMQQFKVIPADFTMDDYRGNKGKR